MFLAIIPARAGSKGVTNKNIRLLAGKPLLAWSIEQALSSLKIDKVIVSTDCEKIASIAKSYGAETPFLRPVEFSTDTASTEVVLEHAIDYLKISEAYIPKAIVLLQPTCPVRARGAIDRAIEQFEREEADSLLSACEIHPFLWKREKETKAHYDFKNRPRRQELKESEKIYEENGSIYITKTTLFQNEKNRLGGKISIFEMSSLESYDIDTEQDLTLVDTLMRSITIL